MAGHKWAIILEMELNIWDYPIFTQVYLGCIQNLKNNWAEVKLILIQSYPQYLGLQPLDGTYPYNPVAGLEHFLFSHILRIIIPID